MTYKPETEFFNLLAHFTFFYELSERDQKKLTKATTFFVKEYTKAYSSNAQGRDFDKRSASRVWKIVEKVTSLDGETKITVYAGRYY